MATDPNARLDIGRVINRTFGAIGANLVTFLVLSVLLAGIPAVASNYLAQAFQRSFYESYGYSDIMWRTWGVSFVLGLIALAASYVLTGAITHGSIVYYNGRKAGVGECLATGFRFALPLFGLAIISGVGMAIGLILLVVPGIILALMWCVSAPAAVIEGTGVIGSLQRSTRLTSQNRWRIFWLLVVYVVLAWIIQVAILLPMGLWGVYGRYTPSAIGSIPLLAYTAIVPIINAVVSGAGVSALYFELRVLKDGVSTDDLAKVFE